MSFFDKFGKKVEEATQVATKKSSELVGVTKLNANIKSEEQNIEKLYAEIGKRIYTDFCTNSEIYDEFSELCDEIKESHSRLAQFQSRVRELKNIKLCSNCNAEVSSSSAFCDQCGAKLDED